MRINGFLSWNRLCRIVVLSLLMANIGCCATNGWALNRAGIRQYNRGHYAQARSRFARALKHDPCNPDYRHNLAMAVQKQGDAAACEQILRHNLTVDAMHQPTYHSLAQLMVAQGRAPEAQDLVTTWAATQPYVPASNIELAWVQQENGDLAGAEQSLQTALRADPANPVALAHLGQIYQGSGRPDQAVAYYQRSLAANWNQPEVQSRLATLSEPGSGRMSRSAMMQNSAAPTMMTGRPMMGDPMMASGMMFSDSMMASAPVMGDPMVSSSPMMASAYYANHAEVSTANYDGSSDVDSRRRRRQHRRNEPSYMTSTVNSNSWTPTLSADGIPLLAYQTAPETSNPVAMTQANLPLLVPTPTADVISTPYASYSNSSTQVAQFDPAHGSETGPDVTASLPVTDPH